MSVFTTVTPEQLRAWLRGYSVGELQSMQGILAGIENTNYFVTTDAGRYVLTLFEKLRPSQLNWYLGLMAHLARHAIPCPAPIADHRGQYLGELNGKPAALVTRLSGAPVMDPQPAHCTIVGEALGQLHHVGASFPEPMENLRGAQWWQSVSPSLLPFLDPEEAVLLRAEIDFQARQQPSALPRGVVHADLFRDNVLFEGGAVGGLIDFYFACKDALVYDLAITLNDWCMGGDARLDPVRVNSMLAGYRRVRTLTIEERVQLPAMLRAGALRFWVSRLYDYHLPRAGELTHAHDPEWFRRILQNHIRSGFPSELIPH